MRRADHEDPLATGLTDWEGRFHHGLLERLGEEYQSSLDDRRPQLAGAGQSQYLNFLKLRLGQEMLALEKLRAQYAHFESALKVAREAEDRQHVMLNFARDLGATPRQLKADEAAFARWFDADALKDRYRRRHAAHEHYAAFLVGRLGAAAVNAAGGLPQVSEQLAFWKLLQLEPVLKPLLAHDGDARLKLAAFRCLATVLSIMQPGSQEQAVEVSTLQYIYRSALQHQQHVWIQCAALELLATISWPSFERVLQQRLLQPAAGDDLFYRRRAVGLVARHFQRLQCVENLIPALLKDPSPYVRQGLPKVIVQATSALGVPWLRRLVVEDASPQARAAAWLELPGLIALPAWQDHALELFREVVPQETDEFVLRVICLVAEQTTTELVAKEDPFLEHWQAAARAVLLGLRCGAGNVKVRRWASQALEFIWSECLPPARALREQFAAFTRSIPRGRSRRLPDALTKDLDPVFLGRIWSIVCRNDYDVQLKATRRGYKVVRGHVFGFRWWRWWYEFRNPSPDKRQAFSHTIGRLFDGQLHVPSGIMAELAQTKVPGEPLHIADEGGWRPYLPLLDQITSSVELGRAAQPFRIFTSEGTTSVTPPRGKKRWLAAARLTWHFRQYAEKRNWLDSMQEAPTAYIRTLEALGFKIAFEPYPGEKGQTFPADPMVQRFFSGLLLLPGPLLDMWDRFQNYFISLYQNSITELAVFGVVFGAGFFALHFFFNLRLKYWRKRIPVIVGGWGTRGKSGTERLKAALFNALGLGVVSKTTGCEAMFLQAYPFGEMKEMFLFRPYDKATIWEQVNVVRLAGRLKTDVMLWECMGLTPSYVKILQRGWMRDQISTITNTYPDHEDLQGPAGINIPEVIACFIPEKSTLITSEEQMLPILVSEAKARKTAIQPVTWLEAGLIPADILQRFPYEEHPYNIALVLGLAEKLGIDRDFALKEMADRVVPDLGVLKTYPAATIRTRRLEFTNGMSANERFGTISNWLRTGFDRQDFLKEPGVWLTTVVNNRADRVPRSQVFASVLVNDLSADRHVLIGGNLNGLQGYIRHAWKEKAPQLSLWKDPAQANSAEGLRVLEQQALQMRLPVQPELIQKHLRIMLASQPKTAPELDELVSLWEQPDALKSRLGPLELGENETAILTHLRHDLDIYKEYVAFAEQIRQARPGQARALNQRFRELLQQWFQTKIIVVEDYYASGNQIVDLIARQTPPGFLNRIMGIQNIKGTGLDFVYRWQAWQACYNACQPLRAEKVKLTPQLLAPLIAFDDFGILCDEHVRDTIARVKNSGVQQPADLVQELDRILERLNSSMAAIQQKSNSSGGKKRWSATVVLWLEEFLDAGDAVRRRSQADRIYEDLISERISRERAVAELQALTLRQKGGWLLKKFYPAG